jgi:quercetin dioxygenase-like cupin family protein
MTDQPPAETAAKPDVARETWVVAQTPALRVTEYVLPPGKIHQWHHHSEVTDRFYCLEGVISVERKTLRERLLLRPGESCTVTPGVVHRAGNAATGVSRYLLVQGIGRYDFVTAEGSDKRP